MSEHGAARATEATARLASLDVLRGFAVLGILVPNIVSFGWPMAAMTDPETMWQALVLEAPNQPFERASNRVGYEITSIFFLGKFMLLFSLLFGAGVVLFDRKTDRGGGLGDGVTLWYGRCAWLLLFGLVHAFGLWYGDILVWYALCGMGALWWLRRQPASRLMIVGVGTYLAGTMIFAGLTWLASLAAAQGHETMFSGIDAEVARYAGTYQTAARARLEAWAQLAIIFPFTMFWQVTGMMLIGMGLTRAGVLTGQRSARFYGIMAASGILVGALASAGVFFWLWRPENEVSLPGLWWMGVAQLLGMPLGLGYAGVVLLLVRGRLMAPVIAALGSVGRMALTNYLIQTIICTTAFYGWGFGLYAKVQYPLLFAIVGLVWLVNVTFSIAWLSVFRFGPAEWAWRSLTYGRVQRIR